MFILRPQVDCDFASLNIHEDEHTMFPLCHMLTLNTVVFKRNARVFLTLNQLIWVGKFIFIHEITKSNKQFLRL